MPVSPMAQQLAQMIASMQRSQPLQTSAAASLMNSGTGGLGTQPPPTSPLGSGPPPQGGGSMSLPTSPSPGAGSSMLQQLLKGMSPMGGPQGPPQPQTLGVNQPIPMQMPNADPQGQQQQDPLPPEGAGMGGM